MTRIKFFTYLMPLAIAGGLALGLSAAPAEAHCARKHTGDHAHCTSDNTGREDTVPASSGFDNDATDDILSDCTIGADPDGNNCYVNGEDRVKSTLGGQRPARFFLRSPKSSGKNLGPQITLDLSGCVPEGGVFGGCERLQAILGLEEIDPAENLKNVTIEGFVLVVRPYATTMKCPEEAEPCGEINVFTMDPGPVPVPMGLWIYMGGSGSQLELEFASRIDPRSSIDPGRGAEICFGADASDEVLENEGLTDVMVTASETGEFVNEPGQNNSWEVQAAGGTALVYLSGTNEECVAKITGMSFLMRIERRE